MQRLLQLIPQPEMRLPPRRNIHNLTRPRIPRSRLGFGIFRFEDAESPNLDTIPFDELLAHDLEEAVDHVEREIVLGSSGFRHSLSQVFLRDRFQEDPSIQGVEVRCN